MDQLARDYAEDAHHLFIYTRETHPEHARGIFERFTSFEEKMERAVEFFGQEWSCDSCNACDVCSSPIQSKAVPTGAQE